MVTTSHTSLVGAHSPQTLKRTESTMKLFYKPGACSLASHITLHELGATFDLERVNTDEQTTESGTDYRTINAKGYVPALRLDSGDILTEGAAILQYIADQNPAAKLAPAAGTLARAHLQSHLNYVASELHKAFSPFFANSTDAEKEAAEKNVKRRIAHFEEVLSDGRDFLLGDTFSVADAYFFVVASWSRPTGIDLSAFPRIGAYLERVAKRPAVQKALAAEGLS